MPASTPHRPRITVITPSLNQGAYIERAICSVIDQGYERLEYIVVDGGSVDESVPLIQHYDDNIAYWHSQRDRGPADALNQALRRATGEWVCFVSADDVLLPGVLEQVADRLATTEHDWLVGHCHHIGGRDEEIGRVASSPVASLEDYLTHDACDLPLHAAFFRRSLLAMHGGFDASLRHAYGYELNCRLLAAQVQPQIIPVVVSGHRDHADSHSARHVVEHGQEYVAVTERYAECLPLKQRYAFGQSCEERRRLYALAEAESRVSDARRAHWQQMLRHPWWLLSDTYRAALLRDAAPARTKKPRRAA